VKEWGLAKSSGQVSGTHEVSHYSTSTRLNQSPVYFKWEGFSQSMRCLSNVGGVTPSSREVMWLLSWLNSHGGTQPPKYEA
jgi:hypothetical protein